MRRYTRHKYGEKQVLDTWTQERCVKCGKFLSKFGKICCDKCRAEINMELNKIYQKKIDSYQSIRGYIRKITLQTIRTILNIPLPRTVRKQIECAVS